METVLALFGIMLLIPIVILAIGMVIYGIPLIIGAILSGVFYGFLFLILLISNVLEQSFGKYFYASVDFFGRTILGIFLGACLGSAFKLLFDIQSATVTGLVLGCVLGGIRGVFIISIKWNLCYENKHEYITVHPSGDWNFSPSYESCKWCTHSVQPIMR